MADRVPVFELHIRPLFRMLDRDHMIQALDLWSLTQVWEHRDAILDRVRANTMPPSATGGPWPEEYVSLFERWIQTGTADNPGHHLEEVTAQSYELKKVFGQRLRLEATVTVPSTGYQTWFELVSASDSMREYRLVAEPPYPAQVPSPTLMAANEKMPASALTRLIVWDAAGRHEIVVQ